MFYSITIKLPKNKTKQYADLGPIPVSELNIQDFNNLINQYQNHITLAKNLNNLELNNQKYSWQPTQEQLSYLNNYYSNNPIGFADNNTQPGENNTYNIEQGTIIYNRLPHINKIDKSYSAIGLSPIPFIRLDNTNIKIPTSEINALYLRTPEDPTPEIFAKILNILLEKNILKQPLSYNQYKAYNSKYFILDNILYRLPNHKILDDKTSPYYQAFYNVKHKNQNINIERFEDNFDAWITFLLTNKELNFRTFDAYRNTFPEFFSPKSGQQIHYFTHQNRYYFIPSARELSDTLRSIYYDVIVAKRPSTNSIGNRVLQNIREENKLADTLPDGLIFQTEFNCKNDPRYENFVNEVIDKGRGKNIFLYLMSSIKARKTMKTNEQGKNVHCFNLHTNLFENIPDIEGGWKEKIRNKEIHEFEMSCHYWSPIEQSCTEWKCTTNTPDSKGIVKQTNTILKKADFMPERYSFDAVITDSNNNVKLVLEFDGLDHYIARKGNTVANKIVSDQIKENFCKKNNIKSIRIPYFSNHKSASFEQDFEAYAINIIKRYYNILDIQNRSTNLTLLQEPKP